MGLLLVTAGYRSSSSFVFIANYLPLLETLACLEWQHLCFTWGASADL